VGQPLWTRREENKNISGFNLIAVKVGSCKRVMQLETLNQYGTKIFYQMHCTSWLLPYSKIVGQALRKLLKSHNIGLLSCTGSLFIDGPFPSHGLGGAVDKERAGTKTSICSNFNLIMENS